MSRAREGSRRGGSLGSAYFLGFVFTGLGILLWLRGLGRLLLPLFLIGAAVYGVRRLLQLVRAPVDPDDEAGV